VRFELVELLSHQSNAKEALLAELLPLQDEAPGDIATQKKLGQLFLVAGSPARSGAVYRDILRGDPRDAEAHAGLAEAEFASGSYRAAWAEFSAALRLNPEDQNARRRFEECMEILALDPMLRGIGGEERLRRSRKLVEYALTSVKQCMGDAAPKDLAMPAEELLKRSGARRGDLYEDTVELAERLWDAREMNCKQGLSAAEEPVARVFASLAQK
jgi:tetratricopeptide (TPR) repeat protein